MVGYTSKSLRTVFTHRGIRILCGPSGVPGWPTLVRITDPHGIVDEVFARGQTAWRIGYGVYRFRVQLMVQGWDFNMKATRAWGSMNGHDHWTRSWAQGPDEDDYSHSESEEVAMCDARQVPRPNRLAGKHRLPGLPVTRTHMRNLATHWGTVAVSTFLGPAHLGDRRVIQVDNLRLSRSDASELAIVLVRWVTSLDRRCPSGGPCYHRCAGELCVHDLGYDPRAPTARRDALRRIRGFLDTAKACVFETQTMLTNLSQRERDELGVDLQDARDALESAARVSDWASEA